MLTEPIASLLTDPHSSVCAPRDYNQLDVFCSWRKPIPKPSDVAFGVVATLVAILPLRSVLVPPAITDLTRLDILFGLQAAALVGLSLILVVIWGPVRGAEARA